MMTKKISKERRKGLGKKSAFLLSTLSEKNKNIFTADEAKAILHGKKPSVIKLLHDLTKKRWLFRLSKGKYLILPLEAGAEPQFTEHEFVIASKLIFPYYLSYWSALNYYGLTEQVSKTIFIATTKRRQEKEIKGLKFKFTTLDKRKFFGFKKIMLNRHAVNIAEREKAIIDCLDLPRNCGDITEAVKAVSEAREELDFKKLVAYGKRMHKAAILNRLGYILELWGIEANFLPGRYYVLLDPTNKKTRSYNKKWKIIENVSREELLSGGES